MKRKKTMWLLSAAASGVAGYLLLDALFLEKYFFKTKVYDIGDESGSKKLKLLLLTDLHLKHTMFPYYRRLARKVNALQPDLLLITGDTLDATGEVQLMDEFLGLLPHHTCKVAIPGNNDYKANRNLEKVKQAYERHNCDFLVNESKAYTFGETRVMVTGLDDLIEGESSFDTAVKGIGYEAHHLLLVHSPLQQEKVKEKMAAMNKEREAAEQLNIRYIFAGHTHGGQVRLPGYVPVLPGMSGDYVNGWYNTEAPYLYVSKGFGTSTIPFRFDARAEIVVFNYGV